MLKKILLGLLAVFFILVGISILTVGYFFTYPEKFFSAVHSVTERVFQGQPYEEKEEFFLQGIDRVDLVTQGVNFTIETYSGSSLKVVVHGAIPRFEQSPFVSQNVDKNSLHLNFRDALASSWFRMNVNGEEVTQKSDAQLEAQIYLPESFKGYLSVKTHEGQVKLRLPEDLLYELDLQSNSGKIENTLKQKTVSGISPQDVGHIKIQTETGAIFVEPR